jgi:PAS domain S-box-containing protein
VTDDYGYILMANESVYNVYGYRPEELIGQHISLFSTNDEDTMKRTFAMLEELFDQGIVRNFAAERRHKSGRVIQVEASVVQLKYPDGTPSFGITTSRDISERRRIEDQLRQSQKMEAIGTLAGGIAHDFNNILGVIFGFTELSQPLVEGNSTLEGNLAQIYKAAERARDLVRQILAFSRKTEVVVRPLQIHSIAAGNHPDQDRYRRNRRCGHGRCHADSSDHHESVLQRSPVHAVRLGPARDSAQAR